MRENCKRQYLNRTLERHGQQENYSRNMRTMCHVGIPLHSEEATVTFHGCIIFCPFKVVFLLEKMRGMEGCFLSQASQGQEGVPTDGRNNPEQGIKKQKKSEASDRIKN